MKSMIGLSVAGFMAFFWFLVLCWRFVPDVIRFLRKRPLHDPVSFWAVARYMADWGQHTKRNPSPWIAVLFACGLVLCALLFGFVAISTLIHVMAKAG